MVVSRVDRRFGLTAGGVSIDLKLTAGRDAGGVEALRLDAEAVGIGAVGPSALPNDHEGAVCQDGPRLVLPRLVLPRLVPTHDWCHDSRLVPG